MLGLVLKKTLFDRWGCNATNLANAAWAKWQRSGVSIKKKTITWARGARMELAFLSYKARANKRRPRTR